LCAQTFGYGKYFPRQRGTSNEIDHEALFQFFFVNQAAFEYKTDKGPVKLLRGVNELAQLPLELKQEF
jgi:hypothetical protein